MLARRLSRLDPKTVEWLRVAAVIGREFDAALLEQLVALDEEQFLAALEEALAAGLLLESTAVPGRYSFSHALIREALYEGMSAHAPRADPPPRRRGAGGGRRGVAAAYSRTTSRAPPDPADAEKAITYAARARRGGGGDPRPRGGGRALLAGARGAHPVRAGRRRAPLRAAAAGRRGAGALGGGLAGARRRSSRRRRSPSGSATARASRAPRSAPRGAYVQQPGVVDTELIALLERALELTEGQRHARPGPVAGADVRSGLLLPPARADGRAQRRGDRDRRAARRSRGSRPRARGAPARAVGRRAPAGAARDLDRDADAGAARGQSGAPAPGARVARARPARARRPRRGRRPDRGVQRGRRAAAPAAVPVAGGRVAGDAGAARRASSS